METIKGLIQIFLNFVQENLLKIITAIILIAIFYSVFYITTNSLKRQKVEVFSAYPFDLFLPRSGRWSVGYFMIIVLFLGLLLYFLAKGGFYLRPS